MNPILIVIGTRPDAIKLIPLYLELKENNLPVVLCSTSQHGNLLDQVLDIFNVKPDISLSIMRPNQDLFYVTSAVLDSMKQVLNEVKPSLVVVQGDTTTAMASSLAAFYLKLPIAHVESGIRTFDNYCPFPEEVNRKIIATVAKYNFAPTKDNVRNLLHEGISSSTIFEVGNTVTDALRIITEKIIKKDFEVSSKLRETILECRFKNRKIVLFTTHRRESFGDGIKKLFSYVADFLDNNPEVTFFFPVHPNPNVKNVFFDSELKNKKNLVFFDPPLDYIDMVYLLNNCHAVVTDSGGLQEEAAALNKFCVVLRERTDRPESMIAGLAEVVGYNKKLMFEALNSALFSKKQARVADIYGSGFVSKKIVNVLLGDTAGWTKKDDSTVKSL